MKYRFLFTLAAFAPMTLAAQGASASSASNAQGHAATPQARIDAAVDAAAKADIPTSLLTNKVREGEAKKVPQDRIAGAVESRLKSLLRASSVLDRAHLDAASAADFSVTADAIEAGVSENALVKLNSSAPDERRVAAVAILADLVRLGKSSDQALAQVNAAVTTSAALANLNAQVSTQLRLGGLASTLDGLGILKLQ